MHDNVLLLAVLCNLYFDSDSHSLHCRHFSTSLPHCMHDMSLL